MLNIRQDLCFAYEELKSIFEAFYQIDSSSAFPQNRPIHFTSVSAGADKAARTGLITEQFKIPLEYPFYAFL